MPSGRVPQRSGLEPHPEIPGEPVPCAPRLRPGVMNAGVGLVAGAAAAEGLGGCAIRAESGLGTIAVVSPSLGARVAHHGSASGWRPAWPPPCCWRHAAVRRHRGHPAHRLRCRRRRDPRPARVRLSQEPAQPPAPRPPRPRRREPCGGRRCRPPGPLAPAVEPDCRPPWPWPAEPWPLPSTAPPHPRARPPAPLLSSAPARGTSCPFLWVTPRWPSRLAVVALRWRR